MYSFLLPFYILFIQFQSYLHNIYIYYLMKFRQVLKLLLISLLACSYLGLSYNKPSYFSHINFKRALTLDSDQLLDFSSAHNGEIIVATHKKGFNIFKLIDIDYYISIYRSGLSCSRVAAGDIFYQTNNPKQKATYLVAQCSGKIQIYKIFLNEEKVVLLKQINTISQVVSILSARQFFPFFTIFTQEGLQFLSLEQIEMVEIIEMRIKQVKSMVNRKDKKVIIVLDMNAFSLTYDSHNRQIFFKNLNRPFLSSYGNLIDLSVSQTGRQMYFGDKKTQNFWVSLYQKIKLYGNFFTINQHSDKQEMIESFENPVTLYSESNISSITIDNIGRYVAYLTPQTLNLGAIISQQTISPIKSYSLSKLCDFFLPFSIQYIYEERLLIPCVYKDTVKILIIHICEAEACTNFCGPICGDCFADAGGGEQCDDCNVLNGDGCSSVCLIQPPVIPPPEVTIQAIYIEKYDLQNKVQIKFSLSSNDSSALQLILQNQNLLSSFSTTGNIVSGTQVFSYLSDGIFTLVFEYSSDLSSINISIDLVLLGIPGATGPATQSIQMSPNDNEMTYFYSSNSYSNSNFTKIFGSIIMYSSLAIFVLGMFGGKLIGVEMMSVIQISVLSLICLQTLNPSLNMISYLEFVNGFNLIYYKKQYLVQPLSTKFKGLNFFTRTLQNFNFTLLLIFIPYLISLICLILGKVVYKNDQIKSNKLLKISKRCAGQYAFNGLMFSGYILSISFALQFGYGIKNSTGLIGIGSILQAAILMCLYVVYIVLICMLPDIFGQFTKFFCKNRVDQKFYLILVVQRLIVGTSLITLSFSPLSILFPLVVCTILMILVILRRPYEKIAQNIRFVVNCVIQIVILILYLVYNMDNIQNKHKKEIYESFGIIVCVLLLICIIYSVAFIIFQLVRKIKGQQKKEEKQKVYEQEQTNNDINQDAINDQKKEKAQQIQNFSKLNKKEKPQIVPGKQQKKQQPIVSTDQPIKEQIIPQQKPIQPILVQNSRRKLYDKQAQSLDKYDQRFAKARMIKNELRSQYGLNTSKPK